MPDSSMGLFGDLSVGQPQSPVIAQLLQQLTGQAPSDPGQPPTPAVGGGLNAGPAPDQSPQSVLARLMAQNVQPGPSQVAPADPQAQQTVSAVTAQAPAPQVPAGPDQNAQPTGASAPVAPPMYGPRGKLGDVLDSLFLHGSIQQASQANYARQMANYQTAQMQRYAAALPPDQQREFLADPQGFIKNTEAIRLAQATPQVANLGQRVVQNGQTVNGAPGEVSVDANGNVVNSASGPTGQTGQVIKSVPITDRLQVVNPLQGAPQAGAQPTQPGAVDGSITRRSTPSDIAATLRSRATAAGLTPQDGTNLVAIGQLESGLNPRAPNNGSSQGLFQFHGPTFAQAGGGDINNPDDQATAAINLYKQNQAGLAKAGIQPTPTNLYLAHQQGLPAATALMKGEPNASAVATIAPLYTAQYGQIRGNQRARQAIVNNGGSPDDSNSEFLSKWQNRVQQKIAAQPNLGAPDAQPQGAPQGGPTIQTLSDAQPTNLLSPAQASAAGFPAGTKVERKPDGSLNVVQGAEYGPEQKSTLRKQVLDDEDYKQAKAGLAAYSAMKGNADTMTGPAAYSMLDTFARAINPGAVARPTVIETIEKNLGLPAQLVGSLESKFGQGNLPTPVRQQILDAVYPFVQAHYGAARAMNDSNAALAQRHGFDPADVTAPLESTPSRLILGQVPAPQQRQPGTAYSTPKGQLVWTGTGWIKPQN